MKKSDLLNSKVFKDADCDLPIRYVMSDGREVGLGDVVWARMTGEIFWDASYASISKRDLLVDTSFLAARHDAEILVVFSSYKRETWGCKVEVENGFITIREEI